MSHPYRGCLRHGAVLLALGAAACHPAPPPPQDGTIDTMEHCPHIPPPPKGQKTPPAPHNDFPQLLRPGYYDWTGFDYSWVPPAWITLYQPTRRAPVWQPGYWALSVGACVWKPAHFLPATMAPAERRG